MRGSQETAGGQQVYVSLVIPQFTALFKSVYRFFFFKQKTAYEIITRQILPNLTAYLAASFVGAVSGGILASVGLEVLGLGPQNVPTIGRTLFYAFKYTALFKGMWWWWGPPIVTLAVIFTGLFWISLSLDKYANPRLKGSARG